MIVVKAPLRISLFGGGSDFYDFYKNNKANVIGFPLNKYIFVILKERFDELIYLNYSQKEIVSSVSEIKHDLIREVLIESKLTKGIEITILADIPTEGCGLGSSSSLTAALLLACYAAQNKSLNQHDLFLKTCYIEIDILRSPIGIQDQAFSVFGHSGLYQFKADRIVEISHCHRNEFLKLIRNFYLINTGFKRKAAEVLTSQNKNIQQNIKQLSKLSKIAIQCSCELQRGNNEWVSNALNDAWETKKSLSKKITNPEIDDLISSLKTHGSSAVKLLGAGAGGYLLCMVPNFNREKFELFCKDMFYFQPGISNGGAKIVLDIKNDS